jgi:hypothetical protein
MKKKVLVGTMVAVASVLAVAAPAHAQQTYTADKRDDVYDSRDSSWGYWNPDLSGVWLKHTDRRLVGAVDFHRYNRTETLVQVELNTDSDRATDYSVIITPRWGGGYDAEVDFGKSTRYAGPAEAWRSGKSIFWSVPRSVLPRVHKVSARANYGTDMGGGRWMVDTTNWTKSVARG